MRATLAAALVGTAACVAAFNSKSDILNDFGTLSESARHSQVRGVPGRKYWADAVKEKGYKRAFEEGAPPYTPPPGWVYNTNGKEVEGKINVHLVPHTHDDTGWQVTVDQYFFNNVYYVLDTVVRRLDEDPNRRFIYVEIGFFARWFDQQPQRIVDLTKKLVANKQLEFINGGWCMHDEASPYYTEMVDQTMRGHMYLKKHFGEDAIPKGTWQIDPFGHSNTEAWLIGAESGMQSLFWGRTDYQDLDYRKAARNHTDDRWPEWVWQGSASLGQTAQVFAGELGGGGYGAPVSFNSQSFGKMASVQDDPRRHDYNIDAFVDQVIQDAMNQAEFTKTEHQMWPCGSDFNYDNAIRWYHNLDKLIHYVNQNGTINLLYSTPTRYVEAKYQETIKKGLKWEVRTDDIFPLGDNAHNYWSGYFTSRPSLKKQVRFASNFMQAARQLEVLAKPGPLGVVTERPSPVVGTSFTDSLEGTIGVATHHDGMSGTERQDVSDDYEQRIAESSIEVEVGVSKSLEKLMGGDDVTIVHCNCNGNAGAVAGDCLNISVCEHTTGRNAFQVVAWNVQGQPVNQILRIPVSEGGDYHVHNAATGLAMMAQAIPLTERDYSLPLLYLRFHELTNASIVERTKNKATHVLMFEATVPAVGYATYNVTKATPHAPAKLTTKSTPHGLHSTLAVYNNSYLEVTVDTAAGHIVQVKNLQSGISTPFKIDWGWYNSSVGGCTQGELGQGMDPCSGQPSGAYMFRPNSSKFFTCGPDVTPTLEVVEGPLVTEIRSTISDWASHVVRLIRGKPYLEVEWTAGPIPINQPWMVPPSQEQALCGKDGCQWGKEVVMRYTAGNVASGKDFYTDSNGREMLLRRRNERGPSYPPLNVSEPIAGNYYPVNAMISIEDETQQFTVVTDVSQGGSSLESGQLELMVHRRVQQDDHRGVQEPLNETMCGCNDENAAPGQMGENGHEGDGGCDCEGLTMRGRHFIIFDTKEQANLRRRMANEEMQSPATIAINIGTGTPAHPEYSALGEAHLPANVKLQTLMGNYQSLFDGKLVLRLAHLYAVDEHPTLSLPVNVSLAEIFSKPGLKVTSVEEMSLTATMTLAEMEAAKTKWPTHDPTNGNMWHTSDNVVERKLMAKDDPSLTVTLRPMELRTLLVTVE
eukprot:m.163286 g.163286  ORF g.163286 m.163286 type:complete len:1147 (+) comp12291_c0_seq1:1380-4820(+)